MSNNSNKFWSIWGSKDSFGSFRSWQYQHSPRFYVKPHFWLTYRRLNTEVVFLGHAVGVIDWLTDWLNEWITDWQTFAFLELLSQLKTKNTPSQFSLWSNRFLPDWMILAQPRTWPGARRNEISTHFSQIVHNKYVLQRW